MRKIAAILLVAGALPAYAQQQTPAEQALSERVNGEIQYSLSVRTKLIETQRELDAATKRLKALEDAKPAEPK